MTVLVVEDDFDFRYSIQTILSGCGHVVRHATDGAEALRYLQEGPAPDLILLDLMMRGMSGRDFRRAQLAEAALAGIPVIILSGALDIAVRARALGVADWLRKPFTREGLLSAVEVYAPDSDLPAGPPGPPNAAP